MVFFKKYFLIIISCIVFWSCFVQASTASLVVPQSYENTDVTVFPEAYGIVGKRFYNEAYHPHLAHPNVTLKTINIYTKSHQIVDIADLFSNEHDALQILSRYCQEYFLSQLSKENLPKENFNLRVQMIQEGLAPKLKNYQHWNITSKYLQIAFDRAQVAPSYFGIQIVDVPLSLLSSVLNPDIFHRIFELQVGDLLFQDLACGELCDGINSTTSGYKNTTVSHVGMIITTDHLEPIVIEADSDGVKKTPLNKFLLRHVDSQGHPSVMVGRVDAKTKKLISKAVEKAQHYLHYPYNPTFSPKAHGFYCSQLIVQSFFEANNHHPVFLTYPMNFKIQKTNTYPAAWVNYFAALKQPIPQGKIGSNPGELSRDPRVNIVYFYGSLNKTIS